MVYKTYKYQDKNNEDKYIMLEQMYHTNIPNWYFDTDFKPDPDIEDWKNALSEVYKFIEIAMTCFKMEAIYLKYRYDYPITYNTENLFFDNRINIDDLINKILVNEKFNINKLNIIFICEGKIIIEEDTEINCNIFNIEIFRGNNIGITLKTNNFAFLPNHPIYKIQQYDIWKLNAPRLARLLEIFNNNSHFKLLTEIGDFDKLASISTNVYYLQNAPIIGVNKKGWDEFHVPFELL